jgi:hypothetical protein
MEEPLVGGMTVGAVRVGDTVRRTSRPWTPAAHAVLRYLESVTGPVPPIAYPAYSHDG